MSAVHNQNASNDQLDPLEAILKSVPKPTYSLDLSQLAQLDKIKEKMLDNQLILTPKLPKV